MAKKGNVYFNDFIAMADLSCKAAEYLQTVMRDFRPEILEAHRKAMHEIEHSEDMVKHAMMQRLAKEFVPPIDREDIIELANEMDNVTDTIEDFLIRVYMYNVRQMNPRALAFGDVIVRCCKALHAAIKEFPNFHKSTALSQAIIEVNTMEEQGDAIYISAMHELYASGGDPVDIAAWSELFDRLEDCCDACEHVADVLEIIVMKNT